MSSYFAFDPFSGPLYSEQKPYQPRLPSPCSSFQGRSIATHKSKEHTVLCSLWLQNKCSRSDCSFSHNPDNIKPRYVPRDFKTQPCHSILSNTPCTYNFNCNFAHENEQIIRINNLVYVKIFNPRDQQWVVSRIGRIYN